MTSSSYSPNDNFYSDDDLNTITYHAWTYWAQSNHISAQEQ